MPLPEQQRAPPSTTLKPTGDGTSKARWRADWWHRWDRRHHGTEARAGPAGDDPPPATEPQPGTGGSTEPTTPPTSPPGDTVVPELSTLACHGEGRKPRTARRLHMDDRPDRHREVRGVAHRRRPEPVVYQSDNLSVTAFSDTTVTTARRTSTWCCGSRATARPRHTAITSR